MVGSPEVGTVEEGRFKRKGTLTKIRNPKFMVRFITTGGLQIDIESGVKTH